MIAEQKVGYSPKLDKIVIFWDYIGTHSTWFIEYDTGKMIPCNSINAAKLNSEEWYEVGRL